MAGFGDRSDVSATSFVNRPPDQVAYVVPDMEKTLAEYSRLFGISDWVGWDYTGDYLPNRFYKGQPAEYRSLAAVPAYGPRLEVIQPIDGPSVFTTFLEERGAGLHHLGWFVPSMTEVREWFAARGIEEVMSGSGQGVDGDGEFTYFDTVGLWGSYAEFIEVPARRFDPHLTWHFDV
ncbi:VOC family protein [Microbacterium sp.]|uniref:VOC family protein n=1 Tax=Microbacterium sp. TaxID=51671 RepID=UPI003A86A8FA